MDEPIAVAVAYGLDNSNNRYVLVFDLGGGATIDVSLLCIENSTFRVKATTFSTLLSQTHTVISVDCLYEGIDFSCCMSQRKFDELNADLYSRCMNLVEECIGEVQIVKQDIGEVVLVGGSTRIPKVQYLLQEYFQEKWIRRVINPDEVVAYGATILAAKLNGQHGLQTQ